MGNDKVSIFARKAPYHYGWDWGPRFVTSGIWRPVYIKAWSTAKIESVQFVQLSLTEEIAALNAVLEINSEAEGDFILNIKNIKDDDVYSQKSIRLNKGKNRISAYFEVAKPKIWWPNGLGEQHLYSIETSLEKDKKLIDKTTDNIGFRTVQVIRDKDESGTSFYFKINGIPVFMKGANYIPSDVFLNRVTPADYEKIIKSASDANMNMLRVWGGGIYENDLFYQLCDRYGILVWQDFMFACSMYPGDEHFLENVRQEAIDNVKRLRNHPSVALWCGNNEIEDAWANWGWKRGFSKETQKVIYDAYKELFFNIIPGVCKEYDGTRFYWPSSPSSDFGRPSGGQSGDLHYWGVWHGKEPFEYFQRKTGRFISEYGFQSFPEFKTVKSYTLPEDWDIESEVMAAHQRSGIGNLRIRDYLKMYYKTPKDFQSFLYVGQVLQAYGIKQAIEAHRRIMPYCMGTLYWQINDCWPVASWSSMDYYKRWKAQQYIAKKAFTQILVSPLEVNRDIRFYIASDKPENTEAELSVKVMDFSGKEIFKKNLAVSIMSNFSKSYMTISKKDLLGNSNENNCVLIAELKSKNELLSENLLYFSQPKDLALTKPEIKCSVSKTSGGYNIELVSDRLAKDVYLSVEEDGFFTDNFFDLIPGTKKKIQLLTDDVTDDIKDKIKIVSLADSY